MNTRSLSFLFPDGNSVSGLKIFKEAGSSLTGFYFTKDNFNKVKEERQNCLFMMVSSFYQQVH